ncbi:MAG: hypothetical protein HOF43_12100, partial [Chloroflexi bacterium]|nr:hypothetical protein [Chloroflexota bacterium]
MAIPGSVGAGMTVAGGRSGGEGVGVRMIKSAGARVATAVGVAFADGVSVLAGKGVKVATGGDGVMVLTGAMAVGVS